MPSNIFVKTLRYILFPVSIVYGCVVQLRNLLFDYGWLKSTSFDIPIIAVGNLSVGGTGKTPQIEYLIRLLENDYKIAVLSRGYKRESKGFVLANSKTTVEELGDEPFQFYTKFPNAIIAVDADRTNGIKQLLKRHPEIDMVLMDDAYQHRKVKASFYTLLTSYEKIFSVDFMLPTGDLREPRVGVKRADVIVVTKCPENLTRLEQEILIKKMGSLKQKVFFTSISYDASVFSLKETKKLTELKKYKVLLITGIAKPKPLLDFCEAQNVDFKHLEYSDHYNFKEEDIESIKDEFSKIDYDNKLILTTEKDFVRLQNKLDALFSLGIKTSFLKDASKFDSMVKTHIIKIKV